ncbi:MAG: tetratricopeptide repeat protein [Salibacteraceae bacterium]
MKKLIVLLLFSITSVYSFSFETAHYDSLYSLANNQYQNQKYEEALKSYSIIFESGLESADLFYNTANCYYKLNQPTQAILYYEKALKLNPSGKDIKYNLELVNKLKVDKIETLPKPFYKEWWTELTHSLQVDTFATLSIVLLFIAVFLLLLFFRTSSGTLKRLSFFLMLVFIIATGITFLFAQSQYSNTINNKSAIVFSSRVNIYSAPNTTSTTLFIVHDGLKVNILKTENQWNQIMLPDGSIGWIPQEALAPI